MSWWVDVKQTEKQEILDNSREGDRNSIETYRKDIGSL